MLKKNVSELNPEFRYEISKKVGAKSLLKDLSLEIKFMSLLKIQLRKKMGN